MKDYFIINRHKFFFQLLLTAILLSIGWTIYLVASEELASTSAIILGYFLSVLVLPLFIQIVTIGREVIEFRRINKTLNNEPFSQLSTIGFTKNHSYRKTKSLSSKPILSGEIDNYPVTVEMEEGVVRIVAGADLDLVEKSHMAELKTIFGEQNVEYDVGIALLYTPSRHKNLVFQDFIAELKQFVSYLRTNKINPWVEESKAKN